MTTTAPAMSVVLTTHNRVCFLSRAIDSVLKQTLSDFELIVVDDCSTDSTEEFMKTYTDSRIRYVRLTQNQGVSAARNTGVRAARADYASFLDDDDEYFPEFLEKTQACIRQHQGVGFVWTGVNRVVEKSQKIDTQIWRASRLNNRVIDDQEMIFSTQLAASCGLTVAKTDFEKAGAYKEGMSVSEDIDLIFRMLASGSDYQAIPVALIQVNIHPSSSLSRASTLQKHIQSTEYLTGSNQEFLNTVPSVWLHYYTVLLANYYRAGQVRNARQLGKKILKKQFFHAPAWERIIRFEVKIIKKMFSRQSNATY